MNRRDRIRGQVPGAPDALVDGLAALPVHEVDMIVAALRQARQDAITDERAKRRQRRKDARQNNWYDEDELAERNRRLVGASGRRAHGSLDALASLADLIRHANATTMLAVDGLRSRGYSDTEIGQALGITRQAVGQHFGRRSDRDESQD